MIIFHIKLENISRFVAKENFVSILVENDFDAIPLDRESFDFRQCLRVEYDQSFIVITEGQKIATL